MTCQERAGKVVARDQRCSPGRLRVWLVMATYISMIVPAYGEPRSRIAIESHVGARAKAIHRAMSYLLGELERRDFAATTESVKRMLGYYVPAPAIADPQYTTRTLSAAVDDGANQLAADRYDVAIKTLRTAIAAIERNPLILAKDPNARASRREAMVYLMRAYALDGNRAASKQAMIDVLRLYPDKVLTATNDSTPAEQIYLETKRDLDRAGRGELFVEVNDPNVVIYLDGNARGRGIAQLGDIIPGEHTIVLENQARIARVFRAPVFANQKTKLKVNWDIDSLFVLDDWAGFLFTVAQDQESDGKLATSLAADRTAATEVAILTGTTTGRKIEIAGALRATASGEEMRRGVVTLTGRDIRGDNQKLEQLAAFLDKGTRHPNVRELPTRKPAREPPKSPPPESPPPAAKETNERWTVDSPSMPIRQGDAQPPLITHRHSWQEWSLGVGGAAVVVAGGVVLGLKHTDTYDTSWGVGEALVAGGGLCILSAIGMHFIDKHYNRPRATAITAAPMKGGVAGAVTWRF